MKNLYSISFIFLLSINCIAQKGLIVPATKAPVKTYDASIIDSTYGITLYEKLNKSLGGDSIRNNNGYACTGWFEDFYYNGKLLHKGYYQEGQLKNYRNFFPNGQMERQFKAVDDYKSNMKIYYPTGTLKSEVDYDEGNPLKWTDYYKDGKVELTEEFNKKGEYYIYRKTFYRDGKPETELTLTNPKKKIYSSKTFYENGQLKEEGEMLYSPDALDYVKNGHWKVYNESGKLTFDQTYIFGKLNHEKSH